MQSFWQTLPRPFTVLAPLDGVTDVVFRQIVTEIGKPDVFFTEFTPCDGLLSNGRQRVEDNLLFSLEQRPIVAQIWGHKPESFYTTAREIRERGFAGIDINMGCPERTVIRDGACSALIRTPELAAEIIQATKEGAGDLPVSVKTRIGFGTIAIEDWIGFLLRQQLSALTVHLRTRAEMSKVQAHWELLSEIVALRNEIAPETILIGNGDIASLGEVHEKYMQYDCEGFMIGRGVFANPWVFNPAIDFATVSAEEKIRLYLHHISLFERQWNGRKNFALLKKFAKTYLNNFSDASMLREEVMACRTIAELKNTLDKLLSSPVR